MKILCCSPNVCHNTLGAFPVLYLVTICLSYVFSLYYGILILTEIYSPESKEVSDTYLFPDPFTLTLLKVFVFNEVIVGAIMIMQVFHMLLCGKISKSQHLEEIEGEKWNVDDLEVNRIRRELEESRVRSE